jgi:hypothetical protein
VEKGRATFSINSKEDIQMSKRIFFFVFAVALFWSTAVVFAQEQAPVPSFKEGDTWQINISRKGQVGSSTDQNEGLYEIVYTQGKVGVFKIEGGQKSEVDTAPDSPGEGLLGVIGKNARRPDLKFPLSVGQKWSYEYQTRGGRRGQRRSAEVNVVGMEQVTIPAGTFKAYKLVRSESWSTGPAGTRGGNTTTYFYGPETRSIVKRSTENENNSGTVETELIKFTPGG